MKRKLFLFSILFIASIAVFAQKQTVRGVVQDSITSETIVGANVFLKGTTTGTVTDIDGRFSLELNKGTYNLQVSFVGYHTQTREITLANAPINLTFKLGSSLVLDGIEITADYAKVRETPVAFTTLLPAKIEERLAGQDIPMLLNKTPGVYATQQGGGDGDARITIRGFGQRFVAVMLDGVPVNDMENGQVYWSNWFGMGPVTRSIQVQRGLGASKLALPSVGGTMNILTKGIDNNRQISIGQEIDQQGKSTTNFGLTSGRMKNGWGISLAGAYKNGSGWVDQTNVEALFLFARVDKIWGKHLTSLTAFGAPQTHKQRSYKKSIADYDTTYAKEHGVNPEDFPKINNQGIGYNAHWGYIKRDADTWNSDQTARINNPDAKKEVLNEQVNTYFKPQISLRDLWTVNDRLTITNVLYLSMGTGGGMQPRSSLKNTNLITREDYLNNPGTFAEDEIGQINWQSIYNKNTKATISPFGTRYPINTIYSDKLYYSNNYLVRNNNNHKWYGLLSTFSYKLDKKFTLSGGADLRSYTSEHYSEITDLLGGDYAIDKGDKRYTNEEYIADPSLAMKRKGDKVNFYYDGLVNWGGLFGLLEYKVGKVSAFVNLTSSISGYKKVDYFGNKESDWIYNPGYTIKTGANYNINKYNNVFFNIGYLSKTQDYKYYFSGFTADLKPADTRENELIKALEFGYSYNSQKFTTNVNTYYTRWVNKPTNQVRGKYTDPVTGTEGYTYGDIPGMNARHIGVELDFIYKITRKVDVQGLVSIGDWIWDKKIDNLQMYFTDDNQPANSFGFDATGIHVGDAAQTQLGASLRYEPIKGLYIEGGVTFFDRYYSEFQAEECTDEFGNPVDSWQIPSYAITDFHAGYMFHIPTLDKLDFVVRLNVLNAFDKVYISDAKNNDTYIQKSFNSFDSRSAAVFFGGPRFVTASLKIIIN